MESTDGAPIETTDYKGKTISIAQLRMGHEYAVEGLFEGWRFANNGEQALQWAKEDIDTGGEAHGWREHHMAADGFLSIEQIHARRQGKQTHSKYHTPIEIREHYLKLNLIHHQ